MTKSLAKNPKQRALAKERTQQGLWLWSALRSSVVLAVWLTVAFVVGSAAQAGALVHAVWLAIVTVAAVTSPVALVLLRRIKDGYKDQRLALTQAETDADAPDHLGPGLARFYADTRLARVGLSDALEPGEGERLLWHWNQSYEALDSHDRELLLDRGVSLGPIAKLLASHDDDDANADALRDAALHLGHIERLLAEAPGGVYR